MEADPAALRMFGAAVRHYRKRSGLPLRELGKRVRYDYSRISRMEKGEHVCDERTLAAIDAEVHAGGLLVALGTAATQQPHSSAEAMTVPSADTCGGDGESVMLETTLPDGRSMRVSISRRQFAQLLATGALPGLASPVAASEDTDRLGYALARPDRVDRQVLDYYGRLLREHYSADKMLGPRQLLSPVRTQIQALKAMRKHARTPVDRPLLHTLSQYGEFAGWLHQDAGDAHAAMYWSDRASEWAQAAGDHQMAAYILIRKSNIACGADDAITGIDLAVAAQNVPGHVEPRIRALAAQQEARGWALVGDSDQCRRRLDTAAELLRQHTDQVDPSAPVYVHHYDLSTLEGQYAICYRSVGRAEDAISILERRLDVLPQHLRRDRAHQSAKLANAVLVARQPEPDRAAQLGLGCLRDAQQTGSARITKELRELDAALMARWPNQPDARALHDALDTRGSSLT